MNRAEAHTLGVGGKGQNAAKAACEFSAASPKACDVTVLVDYPSSGLPTISELITPSEPVSPAASDELLAKIVAT